MSTFWFGLALGFCISAVFLTNWPLYALAVACVIGGLVDEHCDEHYGS